MKKYHFNKRVLVTGGAGFLGSHLCEALLERNCDVVCADNFFTGRRGNVAHLLSNPRFEVLRHDITFPMFVEVDEIYNLACPASPIHYQHDPVQTTKTSVLGAINMLGLAKRVGAKIFQASTSEVYGDPEVHPQVESYWGRVNPIGSRACYDEGKRCAETLFFDYKRQLNLSIKVARIFNTYGPNMHPNDGRVVSNFIMQALRGENITICSIIQCTDGLKDFSKLISNYETDVFSPIFQTLEQMCGKIYTSSMTRPADIAFRVIADHIRCLAFSIADGITPSNEGRGYVLRRILRRAVRYGRSLGFTQPFFYKLADTVADSFGDAFPEVRANLDRISKTLKAEEESFNRTLDRGIELFEREILLNAVRSQAEAEGLEAKLIPEGARYARVNFTRKLEPLSDDLVGDLTLEEIKEGGFKTYLKGTPVISGDDAFKLYDTYGFPLDLTELMAREIGMAVDTERFEELMNEQRERARADHASKKSVVLVESDGLDVNATEFVGFQTLESEAVVEAVTPAENDEYSIVLDKTPCYAEMGGQLGDHGILRVILSEETIGELQILDTQKQGELIVHRAKLVSGRAPEPGEGVLVDVDATRRADIQRHHTATHLFHWALHKVVSEDARQRGSLVANDRMRFDFNSPEKLSDEQIQKIEKLVNEKIEAALPVYAQEVPFTEVQKHPEIQQFFGEKYGDTVRVLQCGGAEGAFDGFSMELCGGCHVSNTGDIGTFKLMTESSIAAGIRRIEAACGPYAEKFIEEQKAKAAEAEAKAKELEEKKAAAKAHAAEMQAQAPAIAEELLSKVKDGPENVGVNLLIENMGEADAELLSAVMDALQPKLVSTVAILGGTSDGKVALVCAVTPDLVKEGKNAGKIVGAIAKQCGGGGGGKPDRAQAGGRNPDALEAALNEAKNLV